MSNLDAISDSRAWLVRTFRVVCAAGDMNGDGYADVIIGAEYANYGAEASGSSNVVFGH